jgi:hypothetical protein
MLKTILAAAIFAVALQSSAFAAACTLDEAMTRSSDISTVLVLKLSAKPDEASKIMSDMGVALGDGTVTEQTCVKLDALMTRAKKL